MFLHLEDMNHTNSYGLIKGLQFGSFVFQYYCMVPWLGCFAHRLMSDGCFLGPKNNALIEQIFVGIFCCLFIFENRKMKLGWKTPVDRKWCCWFCSKPGEKWYWGWKKPVYLVMVLLDSRDLYWSFWWESFWAPCWRFPEIPGDSRRPKSWSQKTTPYHTVSPDL